MHIKYWDKQPREKDVFSGLCLKMTVTRSNVCNAAKSMKLGSDPGADVALTYWELNISLAHYRSSGSTETLFWGGFFSLMELL